MNLNTNFDFFMLGFALGFKFNEKLNDAIPNECEEDECEDEQLSEFNSVADKYAVNKDNIEEIHASQTHLECFNLLKESNGDSAAYNYLAEVALIIKDECPTFFPEFILDNGLGKDYCFWMSEQMPS